MPTLSLPEHPSLVQLRKQARELQHRWRSGDARALKLLADHYPGADRADASLHLAQLVLARSYGFASWPRLVEQLQVIREFSRSPAADPADADPVDVFLRHAVLRYAPDDGPGRWAVARGLIQADPSIGTANIYTASASADHRAVAALLTADRLAANRQGGPFGWEPLIYLTYARYAPDASLSDVLTTAGLLVQYGADPNAGFLWNGLPTPFTALTGVFGSGERGVSNQPPHAHALTLGRLLLEAGADPNDGQALYNRMFEADDSHLELLFDYGLGSGDGGPWHRRLPEITETPGQLVRDQLGWAVSHGLAARIRLLAGHGVDLTARFDQSYLAAAGRTPTALALISGRPEIAALLADLGAAPEDVDLGTRLVDALLTGDQMRADELIRAVPTLLADIRARHPSLILRAAVAGSTAGLELLLRNGFDVNALGRQDIPVEQEWETALHFAAGQGDLDLVERLLSAGADPNLRDRRFDATPLGWAEHLDRPEVAARLREITHPSA
jgi:hypothetical protein